MKLAGFYERFHSKFIICVISLAGFVTLKYGVKSLAEVNSYSPSIMVQQSLVQWEKFEGGSDHGLYRQRTPTGWLVVICP